MSMKPYVGLVGVISNARTWLNRIDRDCVMLLAMQCEIYSPAGSVTSTAQALPFSPILLVTLTIITTMIRQCYSHYHYLAYEVHAMGSLVHASVPITTILDKILPSCSSNSNNTNISFQCHDTALLGIGSDS